MSKNIVIQEGGIAKQLVADKLKTNLSGGGTCNWVPEDETQLQIKYIDANGEYEASADNIYGYSKVVVRVPGGAGGEGPGGSGEAVPGGPGSSVVGTDEDGDEAEVSVDSDGDIHTQKIPSSIKVLEPPTNPYGIYLNGQTISTDGMRVDAYLKSGDRWQTIPSNQITLDPTTATYDPSTDYQDSTYDDITAHYKNASSVKIAYLSGTTEHYELYEVTSGDGPFYAFGTRYTTALASRGIGGFVCSPNPFTGTKNGQRATTQSYTLDNRTVYFLGRDAYQDSFNPYVDAPLNETNSNTGPTDQQIAYAICYGEHGQQIGSHQTITASWPQPRTGKPLTDTFEILVAPGYGGDEGDNGNAGTPPPGMLIP